MKKKITAIFAACIMLLGILCSAAGDVKIFLNDEPLTLDVGAYIKQERTMVPLRGVIEAVGAQVSWDADTRTAIITKTSGSEVKFILLQIGLGKAFVNSTEVELDAPAEIVDSRTMVPLRFIMEELGAQSVEWDADNYAVYIKTEN